MAAALTTVLLACITHAAVVFEEYVTKAEVNQYFASMSELLESLTSLDHLTPYFDNNPALKAVKEEHFKDQQKQNANGG